MARGESPFPQALLATSPAQVQRLGMAWHYLFIVADIVGLKFAG
jgi:hypothetical protein